MQNVARERVTNASVVAHDAKNIWARVDKRPQMTCVASEKPACQHQLTRTAMPGHQLRGLLSGYWVRYWLLLTHLELREWVIPSTQLRLGPVRWPLPIEIDAVPRARVLGGFACGLDVV
jgi:hypothetical protein